MKITDDLTKKLAKTVSEIMQSAEVKDATRSKKEEDFLKLHLDNVSVVDLSPDEKPFQDPPKQKEEKQPKAAKAKTVKEEKQSSCEDGDMEEAAEEKEDAPVEGKVYKWEGSDLSFAPEHRIPKSSADATFRNGKFVISNIRAEDDKGAHFPLTTSEREEIKQIAKDETEKLFSKNESLDEAVNVLTEAPITPVKSEKWIQELATVVARSSDTKQLTMDFEAWVNSLYKTPQWQSIIRSPIIGPLVYSLSQRDVLDVNIGSTDDSTAEDPQVKEAYGDRAERDPETGLYRVVNARNRERNAGLEHEDRPARHSYGSQNRMIKIDGKVWSKDGKPLKFTQGHASAVSKKIQVKNPKAKIEIISEAAVDTDEVEKEWKAAKDKKAVIAKYSLSSGICSPSSLRPGAVKLGIRNELNGKRSFAALDNEGKLIIISGTQSDPKVRYVTEAKEEIPTDKDDFMDWFDNEYDSAAGMWLPKREIPLLMKRVNEKKTIKCRFFDIDQEGDKQKVEKAVKAMKKKGYKIFAFSEYETPNSNSSVEYIFYK